MCLMALALAADTNNNGSVCDDCDSAVMTMMVMMTSIGMMMSAMIRMKHNVPM